MAFGISISSIGTCVSVRCGSGFHGTMEFGFDLTKPSQMSASDIGKLKDSLDLSVAMFSTEWSDMSWLSEMKSIVVAYPVGMDLMEYAALKSLFQRMNIKVKRFIDSGMARGLFASEEDLCGNICCVGCNRGSVELTILNIDDGVVEVLRHHVYQDDTEWDFARMDQTIAKLAGEYGGVETVLLHYTKPPKQEQACVQLRCAPRTVRLDDVAASGGALIQAEVLNGEKKDLLPLNLCPFGILCAVGGSEIELLACDETIPVRRTMEIEVGANKSVELELFAVSNGTNARTCIYQTTLASMPEERMVKIVAEVNSAQNTVVSIEANGEKYRLEY